MRIVIEIDGDNVAVHTDSQLPNADSANIVDAGPAPAELLREFGGGEEAVSKGDDRSGKGQSKKPGSSVEKGTQLNPLRAGQEIARRQLGYPPHQEGEPLDTIDAGGAPKPPNGAGKEKDTMRSARKT